MSWPQAALLAGLVKGPTVDDPLTFPANALARERHVIGRLVATGALTSAQATAYLKIPLEQAGRRGRRLSQLAAHQGDRVIMKPVVSGRQRIGPCDRSGQR